MRVWRYEDEEGLGPYHSDIRDFSEELTEMFNKHCWGKKSSITHPGWGEDFKRRSAEKFVSGFISKKQSGYWFKGYTKKLKENGFELVEYNVEKRYVQVGDSGKQLRFRKDKAQRVVTDGSQLKLKLAV